jgi:hypothetical protein
MLKPTFGIPLAVLLLARRDARAVVTGVVITAAANVPLLAILVRRDAPAVAAGAVTTPAANVPLPASLAKRAGELSTFLGEALSTVGGFHRNPESNPATSSLRIDLSALVSRFLGDPMAGARQLVLALAIIAMSAYVVSAAARVERGGTQGLSATVICLVILLCAYHQAYDLVLLTLPVIALAARRLPAELFSPRLRWALLLLFAGLAGNYASSFGVLERLGIYAPADRATPSAQIAWLLLVTLNGAALLLLFVSYSVATLRLARSSPRAGATITASETWRPREPAT